MSTALQNACSPVHQGLHCHSFEGAPNPWASSWSQTLTCFWGLGPLQVMQTFSLGGPLWHRLQPACYASPSPAQHPCHLAGRALCTNFHCQLPLEIEPPCFECTHSRYSDRQGSGHILYGSVIGLELEWHSCRDSANIQKKLKEMHKFKWPQ